MLIVRTTEKSIAKRECGIHIIKSMVTQSEINLTDFVVLSLEYE